MSTLQQVIPGMVPILDRPEERPQSKSVEVGGSVSVPILDRPEERPQWKMSHHNRSGAVPILDRPEERPQSQDNIKVGAKLCSNPRSPRRATAIPVFSSAKQVNEAFQSSIAPKSDRNPCI